MFMTISIYSPSDLNSDANTNVVDFSLFADHWNEIGCSARSNCYCSGADINMDGVVGLGDVQEMSERWLSMGL